MAFINYSRLVEEWHFSEGILSRSLAPSMLPLPSDLAQGIFCSFPLSFKWLLYFPIFSLAFSFCFYTENISPYAEPSCSDKRKAFPFEAKLRNGSCLVHEDGLFPASVLTCLFSLSPSSTSPLLHNSFYSCTHFPSCTMSMSMSILCKPDQSRRIHSNRSSERSTT